MSRIVGQYTHASSGSDIYLTEANTNYPSYVRDIGTTLDGIENLTSSSPWKEEDSGYAVISR